MKRRFKGFYNNGVYWFERWYGTEFNGKKYNARDFVESNGRVFFRVRLSMLLGNDPVGCCGELIEALGNAARKKIKDACSDDYAVGFVKPLSDRATIIDIIKADVLTDDNHDIHLSVFDRGISYISAVRKEQERTLINVEFISSRYTEDYETSGTVLEISDGLAKDLTFSMVLFPFVKGDVQDCMLSCNDKLYLLRDRHLEPVCEYDAILGYNEMYIYCIKDERILLINRSDNRVNDITECLIECANTHVYSELGPVACLDGTLAFVDAARSEFCFFEKRYTDGTKGHPGDAPMIGIVPDDKDEKKILGKEWISVPNASPDINNPMIYDGYKYVWRINSLGRGYKLFRKDGSLMEQFMVDSSMENACSPIVFSSPTCVFIEWCPGKSIGAHNRLSFSTNTGLCRMFMLEDEDTVSELYLSD